MPHVFNAFFAYELPFGKGKMFDPGNSVVRALVDGWTFSGSTAMRQARRWGRSSVLVPLPQAGTCYADYNPAFTGPIRINGKFGDGNARVVLQVRRT